MDATPLAWTPEHVARFWSYWAEQPDRHATYFAFQVGAGVCNFLEHVRPVHGQRTLDYGAGPGYLTQHLLRRGAQVSAVEYSSACVDSLNERFSRERGWEGAKLFTGDSLPWEDNSFDLVCCLETIEHILPEDLNQVLSELQRVLRPQGILLLTTPNSEDLGAQSVFCPHCCHEFHRWQHVRQWTCDTLQQQLMKMGYDIRFCRGLSFHDFQPKNLRPRMFTSPRFWRDKLGDTIALAKDRLSKPAFPHGFQLNRRLRRSSGQHLVAVAGKPSQVAEAEQGVSTLRVA